MRPMATGLPTGPSRLRASDGDRERVVAVIRESWSQGRLSDEELEQRLARALSARTRGDLRKLVADLPAPPQATPAEVPRPSRGPARRRTALGLALVAGAGLGGLAATGALTSDESPKRGRVADAPAPSLDGPSPVPKVTPARLGQFVVDDGIALRLQGVSRTASVPLSAENGGGRLVPGPNRRFVVADVQVVNRGSAPVDPFCGSGGAALSVAAIEDIEPITKLHDLLGNESVCSGGLGPGERTTFRIVFRLAAGDRARQLDLWNGGAEGDLSGATRGRIRLR